MRNRLLNFGRNRCIQVHAHAIDILEDKLAANEEFTLLPAFEDDPRSAVLHNKRYGEDLDKEKLSNELDARKLRVACTREELDKRLLSLAHDAQISLEESGANTLFLAVGVMEWQDQNLPGERGQKVHSAPILLIPVTLTRQSVRSGYKLRRLDEETRVNVTLLEKLRRDFEIEVKGVNPPPEDDSGVDVPKILKRFRNAVLNSKGFQVKDDAYLGIFQFTKFLLWKDLMDRAEELRKNPVVAHLIDTPRNTFVPQDGIAEPVPPRTLDDTLPAAKNFCIRDADSSQLGAVASAAAGLSFVMIGPPGTGKSQTIANIIATFIAMGKTVLFVAEKRAALEVVQHRLEEAGLGPFLLEVHSNKAGKSEIVAQFRNAVDFGAAGTPEEWDHCASTLQQLRTELNATVCALHKRLPNGHCAYRCHGILVGMTGNLPRLSFKAIGEHTPELLTEMRRLLRDLAARLVEMPDFATHPLQGVRRREWAPAWESQTLAALDDLRRRARALADAMAALGDTISVEFPDQTLRQLEAIGAFLSAAVTPPIITERLLRAAPDDLREMSRRGCLAVLGDRNARAVLEGWKIPLLLSLDPAQKQREWIAACESFFLARPFAKSRVRKSLALYSPGGTAPASADMEALLARIFALHEGDRLLREADNALSPVFDVTWNHGQPAEGALERVNDWQLSYRKASATLAAVAPELAAALIARVENLLSSAPEALTEGGAAHASIADFLAAEQAFAAALDAVRPLLDLEENTLAKARMPDHALTLARNVTGNVGELRNWCRLQDLRAQAADAELSPLVEAVDDDRLQPSELPDAFEKAYARASLDKLVNDEVILQKFFKDEHAQRIEEFRNLDVKLTRLAGRVVQALAASRRPRTTDVRDKSVDFGEVGILNSEMTKKTRHKAIRQLFTEIPTILPKLKPCLLMSPLSVAQYLDAAHPRFDAVVFDEASQVPVCDAIGAMARGTQVIITGDPQQLPPTSFFQRSNSPDDEDNSEFEDLPETAESILDECDAAGLPKVNLAWHYRSRHESLIAFSNHHYYGNRLLTNPEAAVKDDGVRFAYVGGVYDRGGSQTNKAEAEAVVAAIAAHYRDPAKNGVSIGVVTFNSQQQGLIEALLDEACLKDEELDTLVSAESREPLFIKNLENVQGDERDIIVFSTTFGRDASGVLSNNFGPINKPGGERRLNVAITRARQGVEVFSSLRAEDIDLSKTASIGARHLKAYLDFAARGRSTLPALVRSELTDAFDSEFERKVAGALRSQGWDVHTQIGCSAYRIDMAVVHPEHPGAYAIGIECDGATYHSSATARDRDRLRQSVLENLGWRIHRVWSTEWFHNTEKEKAQLFETVRRAIAEYGIRAAETALPSSPAAPEPVRIASAPPFLKPAGDTAPDANRAESRDRYRRADTLASSIRGMDPYAPQSVELLRRAIDQIARVEGPVSLSQLSARIAEMLEMKRTTSRLEEHVLSTLPRAIRKTVSGENTYLWPDGPSPTHTAASACMRRAAPSAARCETSARRNRPTRWNSSSAATRTFRRTTSCARASPSSATACYPSKCERI